MFIVHETYRHRKDRRKNDMFVLSVLKTDPYFILVVLWQKRKTKKLIGITQVIITPGENQLWKKL